MPICVSGDAKIRERINEDGRVLAALIGKRFPVADDVWPKINVFNLMIYKYGLMDTWVTMVSVVDREVSGNVPLVLCFSFCVH